jgi:ribosomal protein S12 methylthiotransferase accessory factor
MKAINSRTGIISSLHHLKYEHGDPKNLTVLGSTVSNPTELGGLGEVLTVGGIGFNPKDALMACVGEAYERYGASFCTDYIVKSAKELENCISGWPLYSDRFYHNWKGMVPYNDDVPIAWTRVIDYHHGDLKYAPAALVYHPWKPQNGESSVFASSTNGIAAHINGVKAIEFASLELLERDAFTLAWLSGSPLPIVDPEWTSQFAQSIGISQKWKSRLIDLTCDTKIPIYLVSMMAPTANGDVFAIGASARFDPIDAVKKAYLEAIQTILYLRHLQRIEPDWHPEPDFSNIVNFKDHARLYTFAPEYRTGICNIFPKDKEIQFQAINPDKVPPPFSSLNQLMNHLKKKNFRMFVKRLTTRDIHQFGHEVVRVLSPDLMPLHGHHQMPALQCERLWNLEKIFPFPINSPKSQEEVYPWPHPFA